MLYWLIRYVVADDSWETLNSTLAVGGCRIPAMMIELDNFPQCP